MYTHDSDDAMWISLARDALSLQPRVAPPQLLQPPRRCRLSDTAVGDFFRQYLDLTSGSVGPNAGSPQESSAAFDHSAASEDLGFEGSASHHFKSAFGDRADTSPPDPGRAGWHILLDISAAILVPCAFFTVGFLTHFCLCTACLPR